MEQLRYCHTHDGSVLTQKQEREACLGGGEVWVKNSKQKKQKNNAERKTHAYGKGHAVVSSAQPMCIAIH